MTKYFVVLEKADEYNDEVYTLQDGGTPIAVFTNKEEAEKLRNKKQYERLAGLEIGNYAYDVEDLTRDPEGGWNARGLSLSEIAEALPFANFPEDDDDIYDYAIPEGLTDEQYAAIDKVFKGLSFFDVVEVES